MAPENWDGGNWNTADLTKWKSGWSGWRSSFHLVPTNGGSLLHFNAADNPQFHPPGSVSAHSGKLLSWAPELPAVVNTATLRCSGTMSGSVQDAQGEKKKKQKTNSPSPMMCCSCMHMEEGCRSIVGMNSGNARISPPKSVGEAKDRQDAASSRWEPDCKCLLRAWLIAWSAVY